MHCRGSSDRQSLGSVSYCFFPENWAVLRNTLVVLVREYNRQKERVLLCICTYIILMNCKENMTNVIKCEKNYKENFLFTKGTLLLLGFQQYFAQIPLLIAPLLKLLYKSLHTIKANSSPISCHSPFPSVLGIVTCHSFCPTNSTVFWLLLLF